MLGIYLIFGVALIRFLILHSCAHGHGITQPQMPSTEDMNAQYREAQYREEWDLSSADKSILVPRWYPRVPTSFRYWRDPNGVTPPSPLRSLKGGGVV